MFLYLIRLASVSFTLRAEGEGFHQLEYRLGSLELEHGSGTYAEKTELILGTLFPRQLEGVS